MTDYKLEALSTRSFEHLVQSLALREVTQLVTPFGDGPDGGREATFEGLTEYGPSGSPWNGYGVIQAKFKQRPSASDGRWALSELRKEFRAFKSRKVPRRMPEYYIYVTNAVLSPVERTGGKDLLVAALEKFSAENNLKGYDIWDYDKIRILLDNNRDVRASYSAWVTTGDVLADLSQFLKPKRPDFYKILVNLLQKDMVADQYAKLEQAGHSADEPIPLSQVFIDLPVGTEPVTDVEGLNQSRTPTLKFADTIVKVANEQFLAQAARQSKKRLFGEEDQQSGRFVLIGGPGQGKTTLGQFVCQIFRASLLGSARREIIDSLAQTAMDEVITQWGEGRIPRAKARRLPVRVVLSEFAKELADGESVSLLGYLAKYVTKRAGTDLSVDDIKELLRSYPSLIVLDGLDEVPPSTNRDELLRAVRDFRIDVVTEEVDVLIVATTRPQGYNDDFSPRVYKHLYLVPLPPPVALEYARRLTEIRFGQDIARYEKVTERLARASAAPATARLMRSPLQVTIMTFLVDRMGQPPQERYSLFSEYYKLICQRELERAIPAAEVLRDNRSDIDAIHMRVGLVLQTESERSGGTDSKLTTRQFSEIVEGYLTEEGHDGAELDDLADKIIEAAANRLVFLVGLEAGRIGFEIRSLQEFMAAEGLMDGADSVVQARLRKIAGVTNWRNVFLFAAGKCFSKVRHLRDTIGQICAELNDDVSNEINIVTKAGSVLALDLLEDGPAARQPIMSRTLTRLALELLDLPEADRLNRLFSTYQERTASLFVEALRARRNSSSSKTRIAVASSILRLKDLTGSDLDGLVDDETIVSELSAEDGLFFLADMSDGRPGFVQKRLLLGLAFLSPVAVFTDFSSNILELLRRSDSDLDWLRALAQLKERRSEPNLLSVPLYGENGRVVDLSIIPVVERNPIPPIDEAPGDSPDWRFAKSLVRFMGGPTSASLSAALETASVADPRAVRFLTQMFAPWPLAKAIDAAVSKTSWAQAIDTARRGGFGSLEAWQERERMLAAGLPIADVLDAPELLLSQSWRVNQTDWAVLEFIEFLESCRSASLNPRAIVGLHSCVISLPRSESQAPPVWADRAIRLMMNNPEISVVGVMTLARIGVNDSTSPDWDSCLLNIQPASAQFVGATGMRSLFGSVLAAWGRLPSQNLLSSLAFCAQSAVVSSTDLQTLNLNAIEPVGSEFRLPYIIVKIRIGGSLVPYLDDLVEVAKGGPSESLWVALRALQVSEPTSLPYAEQVLVLHRSLAEVDNDFTNITFVELQRLANARRSELLEESAWRDLKLPAELRLLILGASR